MFLLSNKQKAIWFNKLQCGDCNCQLNQRTQLFINILQSTLFDINFIKQHKTYEKVEKTQNNSKHDTL